MKSRSKIIILGLLLGLMPLAVARAQNLNKAALNGKYYFRHILLVTDATGAISQASSLAGAMNFDGQGKFTFQGQQTVGAAAAASFGGNGTYQVQSNGFVSITNPQKSDLVLNARLAMSAIVGSSTEASGTVNDLFIAVLAPKAAVSNGLFLGIYQVVTLEIPSGNASQARNTLFNW